MSATEGSRYVGPAHAANTVPTASMPAKVAPARRDWSLYRWLAALAASLVAWFVVYHYLPVFAAWFTYDLLGLDPAGRLGSSVAFLSLIHISEPTRRTPISYAVF